MSQKSTYIFFSLFLILFLFGCALKKEVKEDVSWEDEILMAQSCGMDGLKCCTQDPVCRYGQVCCEAPDGSAQNYCSNSCDFGTLGNFCRENNQCDKGLVCSNSHCMECGSENNLCCNDEGCNSDLFCHHNKCVPCGLSGNPCCSGQCSGSTRMECNQGICQECGFGGKAACKNEPFCNPGNLKNNNLCLECGNLNLPCCDLELENGKACMEGLKCQKGFCNK